MNFKKKHYTPIIFDPINPYLKCLLHFIVPSLPRETIFYEFQSRSVVLKTKRIWKIALCYYIPLNNGKKGEMWKNEKGSSLFLEELFLERSRGWLFFHSEVYNHAKHSRRDESTWVTVKNGGKNTINVYMQCVTLSLQLLYLKKGSAFIFHFSWELHNTLLRFYFISIWWF